MNGAAIVPTTLMINECFGVGVVSEPRMASAGVEPWMGSSTEEQLQHSAACSTLAIQSIKVPVSRRPYASLINHYRCLLARKDL